MRSYLKKFVLGSLTLTGLMVLSGCNIHELVQANRGHYNGQTPDGKACTVTISITAMPPLCAYGTVLISVANNDAGQTESTASSSGKTWCGSTTIADYKITKGTRENPEQLKINEQILIDLVDKKVQAVTLIDSSKACLNLQKVVKSN